MNPITMQLVADEYIRMALKEDINSEDVSTNAVMPEYRKGEVQLLAKQTVLSPVYRCLSACLNFWTRRPRQNLR